MALKFEKRYTANPTDFKTYDTERIRQDFLIKSVMVPIPIMTGSLPVAPFQPNRI